MAQFDLDELRQNAVKFARDAVYVGVGAGVLLFQRAQVQRREFAKTVEDRLGAGREQVESLTSTWQKSFEDQVRTLDERVTAIEERVDSVLDSVQARLPEQARDALQQAREAARSARAQMRERFVPGVAAA